jgi:hypothetical protein
MQLLIKTLKEQNLVFKKVKHLNIQQPAKLKKELP